MREQHGDAAIDQYLISEAVMKKILEKADITDVAEEEVSEEEAE